MSALRVPRVRLCWAKIGITGSGVILYQVVCEGYRKHSNIKTEEGCMAGEEVRKGDREEGGGESDARPYGMDLVAECDDNVPNEERERGDCAW